VVQMPGWTGLANARVTIFGDVYQLPADMQVCVANQLCRNTSAQTIIVECVLANLLSMLFGLLGPAGCCT
jgi:hypothetical protein